MLVGVAPKWPAPHTTLVDVSSSLPFNQFGFVLFDDVLFTSSTPTHFAWRVREAYCQSLNHSSCYA